MKKFIVLAIAAALMCSAAFANATEFKVSGQFDLTAESVDNLGFVDEGGTHGVDVKERFRTQIDIIASEYVSGVVYFEIGDVTWGEGESADLGTDGINVETRRAYVNFIVPNTSVAVSAGLMGLVLPNAVAGTPVFNDDVAAATVSVPFNDNFSATAFFARASSGDTTVNGHNYGMFDAGADIAGAIPLGDLDLFGVIVPVNFDKVSVTPYAVYAKGEFFGNDAQFAWIGAAAEANLIDNLKLAADVIYSDANVSIENGKDVDGSGFFLAGSAAYDTEFGTPKLTAWWAQGNDTDEDQDENGGLKDLGFVGFAGWFGPTSLGFDGGTGRSTCDTISSDGVGTAGIAFSFSNVSFIEGVDHEVILAYYELTQEVKGSTPSATEVDFITNWQMYENLSATLELAYVMPDWKYVSGVDKKGNDIEKDAENMFKSAVSLKYAF